MAKAADVPGLTADLPFRIAAARTVRVRADELFAHADGVLDTEDIERVHDMRVATRRLRAVLEVYAACFPPKRHRAVLKEVKALADALGARRDPDVQLEELDKVRHALEPEDAAGVDAFAAMVAAEQEDGNGVLAAALEDAEADQLHLRLHELADAADPGAGDAEDRA